MNEPSLYHRFVCAFARTRDGDLVSCTGPSQDALSKHWSEIWTSLARETASGLIESASCCPQTPTVRSLIKARICQEEDELVLYQRQEVGQRDVVLGAIFKASHNTTDDVFAGMVLSNIKLFTSAECEDDQEGLVTAIVNIFDEHLRYVTANDRWSSHGQDFFSERVRGFVRRAARLELCLPAFPCKSSNHDKVSGALPDRGEQLALEHLDSFVEAVEHIYPPGAKLWIVSDGHVFSDCIGVDDETVDEYNAALISMYAAIDSRRGGKGRIGFKSLNNLFNLKPGTTEPQNLPALSPLKSHISTKQTKMVDLSRRILHHGFGTDDNILRSRITAKYDSTLKLYRGFSKFMLEDLSLNRYTKCLSRGQLKKLATKVSFEMIQRNEAYSNLVELLFPHHVRLSIHAHDNSGPKFGIRLFGSNVRPLDGLTFGEPEMRSVDLLHVPTPWHNCLVEIGPESPLIMTKAKNVHAAISSGKFCGGWLSGTEQGVAGHFRLWLRLVAPKCASLFTFPTTDQVEDGGDDLYSERAAMSSSIDVDLVYMRMSVGCC